MNFNEAKDYLYNRYKYVFKEMKFPSIYERKELGYDNTYYTVMVFYSKVPRKIPCFSMVI